MIKNPYYQSHGSLFWIRQPVGEKVHLPNVQMDLFWRGDRTEATIRGILPDASNLFSFRDGDSLCLLYKDCGEFNEFNEDQIILLVVGCRVLNFKADRIVDNQSDDPMSFELRVVGGEIENKIRES